MLILNINDIILFEKSDRLIKVYLRIPNAVYTVYMNISMKKLTLNLEENELLKIFHKPHYSYIININHIKCIKSQSILMSNKLIIPISNNNKNIFKNSIKENLLEVLF